MAESETVIAKCNVTGLAEDPNYRQTLRCGRHELLADERPARGGADVGPMPFEYLLCGLAACTSITLRMYARRKDWDIGTISVSLALRRGGERTWVERRVSLSRSLSADQQKRLSDICEKTPVTLVVKGGTEVRTTLQTETPT